MELEFARSRQRQLGAFYTPRNVAQMLIEWVVRTPSDTILDPSFGGCAFLHAALETLRSQHVLAAGKQIFGVDIDPAAQGYLESLIDAGAHPEQFTIDNFLNLTPVDYEGLSFDCIVGNPPYVNYHDIDRVEQHIAQKRLSEAGFSVSGRASYWVFFLLHSLRFLKRHGRMAMILPGSFVRADYAAEVRRVLAKQFQAIHIILLQERIFDGTDEQAVLLLAEGYGEHETDENISICQVETVEQLSVLLAGLRTSITVVKRYQALDNLYYALLPSDTVQILREVQTSPHVIELGDWVTLRIGVVTGCNAFFILSKSEKEQYSIPDEYLAPIITRPSYLTGLELTGTDVDLIIAQDRKSLLLTVNGAENLPEAVLGYIDGATEAIRNATKCRERHPWYSVLHRFHPPAFIQYMSAAWPRIVANTSVATCTNNIHRLLWRSQQGRAVEADKYRLSIGSLSALSQLSAELIGRSYGTGVLKLEPKEVLQLSIPVMERLDDDFVQEIDRLLRERRPDQASSAVDKRILIQELGLSQADVRALCEARDYLHQRRRG